MKCIHCGADSDYRTRQSRGACGTCGRRFAFEPRRDRGLTDMTFKLAIESVSDRGMLLWHAEHLFFDLARRVRRRRPLHRLARRRIVSLERGQFDELYERWVDAHGAPTGRLEEPQFAPAAMSAVADIEAQPFERLVVCEKNAVADLLIANGFHADSKTPVLAFSGYPQHVYDALVPHLRKEPPALVVVVHDATWQGCALAEALMQTPRWFAGVPLPELVDAGLRPRDARAFRGLYESSGPTSGPRPEGVDDEEARWLSKYRLSLAAARPRALMAVLQRVLRGEAERHQVDDGSGWAIVPWGDGEDDDDVG